MTTRRPDDFQDKINKMIAEKIKEDAAVTHTQEELEDTAKFLLSWAKKSPIIKVTEGSVLYKKGNTRWSTKLYPKMVADLLKHGFVMGTDRAFTMVPAKVNSLK